MIDTKNNRREGWPPVLGTRWPLIYLTPEGMSLEWEIGGWDITLFTTDGERGEAHGLHKTTGEDWGRELNLHDPEAWRWLEDRLREAEGGAPEPATGGMANLQLRRIDSAIEGSKAIEARLDDMGEQIESVLNDILDHQRTLHAIRLGMIREADEAAAPPPEPAAGPWEPYRDALYDEIKDADDAVWAAWRFDSTANRKWGYAYARRSGPPMDSETTVWETSSGRNLCPRLSPWMRRNPDRIARIIPPKEAPDAHTN